MPKCLWAGLWTPNYFQWQRLHDSSHLLVYECLCAWVDFGVPWRLYKCSPFNDFLLCWLQMLRGSMFSFLLLTLCKKKKKSLWRLFYCSPALPHIHFDLTKQMLSNICLSVRHSSKMWSPWCTGANNGATRLVVPKMFASVDLLSMFLPAGVCVLWKFLCVQVLRR